MTEEICERLGGEKREAQSLCRTCIRSTLDMFALGVVEEICALRRTSAGNWSEVRVLPMHRTISSCVVQRSFALVQIARRRTVTPILTG